MTESSKPAYIIAIRETPITDAAAIAEYSRLNREMAAQWHAEFGIAPLAVYGACDTPEGAAPDGVVILRFPNMASARAWYHSPEYQAVIAIRNKAAAWRVMIVEGIA